MGDGERGEGRPPGGTSPDRAEAERLVRQVESYLAETERQLLLRPDPATAALLRAVRLLAGHLAARGD